jgi:phosphoribosylaminoimidazolecarboxamide formyltransferase / IMP cyclohydrolase
VAVKHTNPCGVGLADNLVTAWQKAYQADPVSIFGGIVAFNGEVNEAIAKDCRSYFWRSSWLRNFTKSIGNSEFKEKCANFGDER